MKNWLSKLIHVLELETIDPALLVHIDDILSWEVVCAQDILYLNLLEGIGEEKVNQRYEEFLDRLIVGDYALGQMFPRGLDGAQAKKRYRKLIRIFHPDRGSKPQEWLNYRAEKINLAYKQFVEEGLELADLEIDEEPLSSPVYNQVNKPQRPKGKLNAKFRYQPSFWRNRLGTPQEFQRKVLSIILILSLLLVLMVYWSNNQVESNINTSQLNIIDKGEVNSSEYIKESKAKKILLEADEFLSRDADSIELDDRLSIEQSTDTNLVNSIDELNEFLGEIEEFGLSYDGKHKGEADECNNSLNSYSDNLIGYEVEKLVLLSSSLALWSGPSIECQLLVLLASSSQILIEFKTPDSLWAKVSVKSNRALSGWVQMKDIDIVAHDQLSDSSNNTDKQKQALINNQLSKEHDDKQIDLIENIEFEKSIDSPEVHSHVLVQKLNRRPKYLDLIGQLKLFYETGNSVGMSGLYIVSGRENQIRGSAQIRKYYRKAFSATRERKFDYTIDSYREDEARSAVIEGGMNLFMTNKKTNKVDHIVAVYTVWLVKLGSEYKIASFEWTRK